MIVESKPLAGRAKEGTMRGIRHTVAVAVVLVIGLSGLAMTSCAAPPPAGCYDSTTEGMLDIKFNGPMMDVRDNATLHLSTDGTCSGDLGPITLVVDVDATAALAKCETLDSNTTGVMNLTGNGYSAPMPADAYWCEMPLA